MQSNETGVADTMYDLIVDTIGAMIVAGMGWIYIKTGRYSFIADCVRSFVQKIRRCFADSAGNRSYAYRYGGHLAESVRETDAFVENGRRPYLCDTIQVEFHWSFAHAAHYRTHP